MSDIGGKVLAGRYQVGERLGSGGMATVYRGHHLSLNAPVAIKMLHPHLSSQPSFVERFRREAVATFNLKHPHIVRVFDFVEEDGLCYMIMEYIDGKSLRDVLDDRLRLGGAGAAQLAGPGGDSTRVAQPGDADRTQVQRCPSGPMPDAPGIVLDLAHQLGEALQHAHALQIVHRDVKPENVLVEYATGRALLSDFGIAKAVLESKLTETGTILGTAAYMSPEQARGVPDLDARSDIYSFGAMLYELLTGNPPFAGTFTEVVARLITEMPPMPSAVLPNVHPGLEQVVMRCLQKDPAQRFSSVGELLAALPTDLPPVSVRPILPIAAQAGDEVPPAEAGQAVCPVCAGPVELGPAEPGAICPHCGREVTSAQAAAERERIQRLAGSFIASFGWTDLDLSQRDFAYVQHIEPKLMERVQADRQEWLGAMAKGSVHAPALDTRIDESPLVCLRRLWDTIHLLRSPELGRFVLSWQARERWQQMTAGLEGRVELLLAAYRSSLAAGAGNAAAMQGGYEAARAYALRAAHKLATCTADAEAASAQRWAEASGMLLEGILAFPRDADAAYRRMCEAVPALKQLQPSMGPGPARDLQVVDAYQGYHKQTTARLEGLAKSFQQALADGQVRLQGLRAQYLRALDAEEAARNAAIAELTEGIRRAVEAKAQGTTGRGWARLVLPLVAWATIICLALVVALALRQSLPIMGLRAPVPIGVTIAYLALAVLSIDLLVAVPAVIVFDLLRGRTFSLRGLFRAMREHWRAEGHFGDKLVGMFELGAMPLILSPASIVASYLVRLGRRPLAAIGRDWSRIPSRPLAIALAIVVAGLLCLVGWGVLAATAPFRAALAAAIGPQVQDALLIVSLCVGIVFYLAQRTPAEAGANTLVPVYMAQVKSRQQARVVLQETQAQLASILQQGAAALALFEARLLRAGSGAQWFDPAAQSAQRDEFSRWAGELIASMAAQPKPEATA